MPALLALLLLFADPHLHGVVRNSQSGVPLQGAVVRVSGTRLGAVSDELGEFHIHDVRGDSVTLIVSMVGYPTTSTRVSTTGDEVIVIDISADLITSKAVVIEANRNTNIGLPSQSTTTLSNEEIDGFRGATLATALERIPGVTILSTGPSIAKPMIHGMTGARIVVIRAGTPLEGQQWGEDHAPEIDPFTPSTVTLLKGAAGVRVGANAMGGAISVDPLQLQTRSSDLKGEASVNFYSNNFQGAIGGWIEASRIADVPFSIRAYGSARKAGDASAPDYVLGNTAFQSWSLGTTMLLGDESTGIVVHGSMYSTDIGIYAGSHIGNPTDLQRAIDAESPLQEYDFSYTIDRPRQEVQHSLLSVKAYDEVWDNALLTLSYGWQQNDRSEYDRHGRSSSNDAPAMNLLLTTYNLSASLDHALSKDLEGAVGVSGLRQVNDRSGTVFLVPDYSQLGFGLWLYETLTLNDWTFSGGLRYDLQTIDAEVSQRGVDTISSQHKEFSGVGINLGTSWRPSADWRIAFNLGHAWRPPQVNELYSNDVHHGVARYEIGDSLLAPERSIGGDLTTSWAIPGFEVEATGHAKWFFGYIMSIPDPANPTITIRGTFPTFQFIQSDAFIGGLDLSATADFSEVLSVYGKGSIVIGESLSDPVGPLIFMPANRVRLGMHVHTHEVLGIHDTFLDASVLLVSEQKRIVVGQDLAPPPPGYATVQLNLGGVISIASRPARISLSINNFFDVAYRDYLSRYRYYADDPGRDVVLRFTIPFGRDDAE